MRGNEGRALLSCPISVGAYKLPMPVQLLGYIGFIMNIDCDPLPLFHPKQWPWKLAVVRRH